MGELVRFGVAIDGELLARFDERLGKRGYANRSEAIRDLIRDDLVDAATEAGAVVAGSLTLVYDHHARDLSEKLTEMQHALGEKVVSTLHVHLDHDHCLEVIVMRGPAGMLERAAERILATKGVAHGKLTLTGIPGGIVGSERGHGHGHGHGHEGEATETGAASTSAAFARKGRGARKR